MWLIVTIFKNRKIMTIKENISRCWDRTKRLFKRKRQTPTSRVSRNVTKTGESIADAVNDAAKTVSHDIQKVVNKVNS
uniref:CsbD family protein n=1 Tax=Rhabditophanes sp. KR3021 TaxID=114890 RepID=A0AC35U077_9BILA